MASDYNSLLLFWGLDHELTCTPPRDVSDLKPSRSLQVREKVNEIFARDAVDHPDC
jgi:hypothetical protein